MNQKTTQGQISARDQVDDYIILYKLYIQIEIIYPPFRANYQKSQF